MRFPIPTVSKNHLHIDYCKLCSFPLHIISDTYEIPSKLPAGGVGVSNVGLLNMAHEMPRFTLHLQHWLLCWCETLDRFTPGSLRNLPLNLTRLRGTLTRSVYCPREVSWLVSAVYPRGLECPSDFTKARLTHQTYLGLLESAIHNT